MASLTDQSVVNDILMRHGYPVEEKLGQGGFAHVFKVTSDRYPGFTFAAKVMHFDASRRSRVQAYDNEIDALRQIIHQNVIKIYDHFIDGEYHVQILEFCEHRSLSDIMKNGRIPLGKLRKYLSGIVKALVECHAHGIIHNDIKPANILIDSNDCAKLADFGAAQAYGQAEEGNTFTGSLAYIAPEMTKTGATVDKYKTDVWALGITLYQLVMRRLPWESRTRADLIAEIREGEVMIPLGTDAQVRHTLKAIFAPPMRRPTMAQVATLPFFKQEMAPLDLGTSHMVMPGQYTGRPKRRGQVRSSHSLGDYSILFKTSGRSLITGNSRLVKSKTFGD